MNLGLLHYDSQISLVNYAQIQRKCGVKFVIKSITIQVFSASIKLSHVNLTTKCKCVILVTKRC